jgi:hypothetical protein
MGILQWLFWKKPAVNDDHFARNFRQFREAGITHCVFMGPNDERATEVERAYDGKRMSIREAEAFVAKHREKIPRSVFRGEVSF